MNRETRTLTAMLAEFERATCAGRVTQKDLARILRCGVSTVSTWLERLEINLSEQPNCARFLIKSWAHCRDRGVTPFGKTKTIGARLGLHEDTITRTAKKLHLEPIILHHQTLRFPIHFWTIAQVKLIAARTRRSHLLTTPKPIAARSSSPCQASTAKRPRVCRSRHLHTRNFPSRHDDTQP